MSLFSAINSALSGLQAQQTAIEVAGQNVTNLNTPGYHRQEAVLTERPTTSPFGDPLGGGVDVTTIRRYQSNFMQGQMQAAEGQVGYWTSAQDALQQIETVVSPDSSNTLSTRLDSFFSAWQALAASPNDATTRAGVTSASTTLTTSLNSMSASLTQLSNGLDSQLGDQVDQLNTLSDQLADLNGQIAMAKNSANPPNGLLDQRDNILQQMQSLAGVTSASTDDGAMIVNLGGRTLVQGTEASHLQLANSGSGKQILWEDGTTANVTKGNLGGMLEIRNRVLPGYQSQLNNVATALMNAVNTLHQAGFTASGNAAGAFFTGTSAADIAVSTTIQNDTGAIATTRTAGATGDGGLAGEIAALANQQLIGSNTLNGTAQNILGQIGNAVQSAQTNLSAQTAVQTQLANQESSVSGVSLDEELTNIMTCQRAYDASSRVLTVVDDMMKTLIQTVS